MSEKTPEQAPRQAPEQVPSGTILCLLRGPTKVLREEDAGERWCFGCRKRLPHRDLLLTDELVFDQEGIPINGYYEPVWVRECSVCKRDLTAFPGSAW